MARPAAQTLWAEALRNVPGWQSLYVCGGVVWGFQPVHTTVYQRSGAGVRVRACVFSSDRELGVHPQLGSGLVRCVPTEPGMDLGTLLCSSQDWAEEDREGQLNRWTD